MSAARLVASSPQRRLVAADQDDPRAEARQRVSRREAEPGRRPGDGDRPAGEGPGLGGGPAEEAAPDAGPIRLKLPTTEISRASSRVAVLNM